MTLHLDFPLMQQPSGIVLRSGDDAWGPYSFDCSGAIPGGESISSAEATAYMYDDGTYTEAETLIEPGSITLTSDTDVQLKLQAADLDAGNYYIKLTLTLGTGGVKSLICGPVIVEYLT